MTGRAQLRKQITKTIRDLEALDLEVKAYTNGDLDLVGSKEAAEILGIKPNTLTARVVRGQFPEPIVTLACGPIWHRDDIEQLQP